jgi:hypothetical protein
VTISFNSGIVSGPKTFKGGSSNVTRQYDEVRRTKRICLVFATLLMFASEFRICGFAIHDLFMSGAKLRQLCSFALH